MASDSGIFANGNDANFANVNESQVLWGVPSKMCQKAYSRLGLSQIDMTDETSKILNCDAF